MMVIGLSHELDIKMRGANKQDKREKNLNKSLYEDSSSPSLQ